MSVIEALDQTIIAIAAVVKKEVEEDTIDKEKVSALATLARARADAALFVNRTAK